MAQIGTVIQVQEVPPAVINTLNTANGFMVGLSDWGPVGASGVNSTYTSLSQVASAFFTPNGGLIQTSRNSNNATLYDSADAFFREGGSNLFISRVIGNNPTKGTLGLQDSTGGTAVTLTAASYGQASSAINVAVNNAGGASYVITLTDANGNTLSVSPTLTDTAPKTDLINWASATSLVTAADGNGLLPKTISATPLSAGSDDRGSADLSSWGNAIGGFGLGLGPGQIMAPGVSDTALPGIWNTLALHAQANNRVALLDGTDGNTAVEAISEVNTAAIPSSLQSYCGLWAGNLLIPPVTAGTTRTVPPSAVVAALCARADNQGNPNLAAAGTGFPLQYASGSNTVYTDPLYGDIATLNSAGINVFSTVFNVFQNYGFVSLLGLPSNDSIYWQLNHARLRMAIVTQATIVAQPFIFSQVDGQGQTLSAFSGALSGMLLGFYNAGALYGSSSTDAFTVNASSAVNNASSLAAGNLVALIAVRMSPFAQLVEITINAVPITQSLIQTAGTSTS